MKDLLNVKLNGYFLLLILFTISFILVIFFILNQLTDDKKLLIKLENSLTLTKELLDEQKRDAKSFSILLAQDKELIESFRRENRKATFNIINKKIKMLKQLQDINFEVQVHDKNLRTFLRSWDLSIKNVPLKSFREGLVNVKKTLSPISSIELGKRLNIKAISPIIHNDEFIGSIEVIMSFDKLSEELEKKNIDFFVLLKNKYLNIASKLKNNPKIEDYTLVNKNSKYSYLNNLSSLKEYGYFTKHSYAYSYFSYYSLKREKLGYIIVAIKNTKQKKFKNNFRKKIITHNNERIIIEWIYFY